MKPWKQSKAKNSDIFGLINLFYTLDFMKATSSSLSLDQPHVLIHWNLFPSQKISHTLYRNICLELNWMGIPFHFYINAIKFCIFMDNFNMFFRIFFVLESFLTFITQMYCMCLKCACIFHSSSNIISHFLQLNDRNLFN